MSGNHFTNTTEVITGGTYTELETDYTEDDVTKFGREIGRAMKKLLIVDQYSPHHLCNRATVDTYEEVKHPGVLKFDNILCEDKERYAHQEKMKYHTIQQAAIMAALDVIEKIAPEGFLDEIKDDETGLDGCTILECLEELERLAEPVVAEEAEMVIARRNEPLKFEPGQSLKAQFMAKDKDIKVLKKVHKIDTSMGELMLDLLLQIRHSSTIRHGNVIYYQG